MDSFDELVRRTRARHPYPKAREAYEDGVPLRAIARRLKLNEGEIRDVAPEEFMDEHIEPEGIGGY